jgi:hypothetical protein
MARITHRNDRMHRGLVPTDQLGTGSASSSTVLLGNQTWGSVPGTSFGSNSNSVGSANAPGASSSNARADHVHQGVHQLTSNGSNALVGDVNVAAGWHRDHPVGPDGHDHEHRRRAAVVAAGRAR